MKPKILDAFKDLESLMFEFKKNGTLEVNSNGEMFLKDSVINELSDEVRKMGFAVKLVGVGKNPGTVKIEFRGLIKINNVNPDFNAADKNFLSAGSECESD